MPNKFVVFNGTDQNNLESLWITDGTSAGTSELSVTGASANGLNPTGFTEFGSEVAFEGTDASGQNGLWVTDGTSAGTSELSVSGAASGGLNPQNMAGLGNELLFEGTDAAGNNSLWVTNGTSAGTSELSIAGAATSGPNPQGMAVFGSEVLFSGVDSNNDTNLWLTNGTAAGTSELQVSGTFPPGLFPQDLTPFGTNVLFNGVDQSGFSNLWVTDGTGAGTSELSVAGAAASGLNPLDFTVLGSKALFAGVDASGQTNLWVTDGTAGGTSELAVANAYSGGLNPFDLTVLGNNVFFEGEDSTGNYGLWETDGTAAGTSELAIGTPGYNIYLASNGKDVLFNGDYNLWVTDGTSAGTSELSAAGASPELAPTFITSVVFPVSAATSTLVATPGSVTADGVSTTTLMVTVEDAHGNAIADTAVTLSGSGAGNSFGTISGTTNANGVFTTTLASTLAQTETITATEGSVQETTSVTFIPGAPSATTSTLVASPGSVTADGASTTTLTVTVEDAQGNLVSNAAVTLSGSGAANSFGTISGTTNANGVFTTTLASTVAQTETITATEGTVHETTSVTFNPGAPSATTSTLVANPGSVTADGVSTTTLTVTVEDAHGNLVPNAAVTLSGSGSSNSFGAISGTTNANGVFTTTLASTLAQTETITATEGTLHESTSVTFNPGAPSATTSTLAASPGSVTADGVSTTTLTVTVEDAQGNLVPNAAVTLSGSGTNNSFGTISGTTNANGVFTTTLASTVAQTETITATEGSVHESTSVTFNPGTPSATTSTLVASPESVTADGVSTTMLTVTVEDAHGNLVPNAAVTLSGSGTANSFGTISGTTNANGVFTTTLASTLAQTETITATEGSVQETTSVTFNPGAPSATTSTLVANPGSVTADGVSITTLTVTVEDAQGNLVSNAAVTLSGTGAGDVFGATSGTTNAEGVFTTTLSSTTAQAADTITATEGSVHETTSVTFNPGAPSATTSTLVASPGSVTADGVSTTTLTVTVEDAQGNLVSNAAVTLSGSGTANSFGTISGTTNASGVFTTTLASTLAQTETITAAEGSVHETTSVTFNSGAPSATTSTLVASPGSVTADGVSTTTLTVTVEDAQGNLVSNAAVTLSGTGAGDVFGATSGTTNAEGVFTTTLSSTTAQAADTITATEGSVHETTSVTFNPGAPSATTSTLVATPGSVKADGVSTTTLTVTVEDAEGNLVPNTAVTLSSSGTGDALGATSGTTNAQGVFTTTLSSTTAQATDAITATEGSVHESTSVTFFSNVIEAFGSTSLVQVGTNFYLDNISTGTGPEFKYAGTPVVAGEFGAWTFIGAEQTSSGYEVALQLPGTDQYTVWNTDNTGNVVSNATGGFVSGTSSALESLEPSFHQDLNGDGVIGVPSTVIESFGSTSLVQVGTNFYLDSISSGTGPEFKYAGTPVVAGEFGAWTFIGAEQTSSGYEVALHLPGTDQYTVWNTDNTGNVVSNATGGFVSGTSSALESLEPSFHQDLNGDGVIGVPSTVIEAFGSTSLVQVGSNFYLDSISSGTGPEFKYAGTPVVAGEFGAWTFIGAEQTSSGYEVALHLPGSDQYTVWNTDNTGNVVSNATGGFVSGTSSALESLEPSFHQDLNGDGVIGVPSTVIESFGSTSLVQVGSNFYLDSISSGTGPEFKYAGTPVVAGEFGAWTFIGAEQTSSGYEVALHLPGSDQYTVWNTDNTGNVVSNATGGFVSGTSSALESLEPSFHQDLNGDGAIGPTTIAPGETTEIPSVFSGAITFAGSTGTLQLDSSSGFSGTVAGLTGQDTLDLRNINPATIQPPTYTGNSSEGTLSVTDGTNTASITLLGNYLASTFVTSSDGHGGTSIVDPLLTSANQQNVLSQPQHA